MMMLTKTILLKKIVKSMHFFKDSSKSVKVQQYMYSCVGWSKNNGNVKMKA